LGGPQAGVIAGRADLVAAVARHPLARAVRADKMALAALQSVALAYLAGDGDAIPLWRMAATPVSALRARAEALAAQVPGAKVVDTEAVAGGGSLPGLTIPSVGLAIEVDDADAALAAIRATGIVARVDNDALVLDLRTVDPDDDNRLATALSAQRVDPARRRTGAPSAPSTEGCGDSVDGAPVRPPQAPVRPPRAPGPDEV
ncbi:MAG TPA: hypothetical protein VKX24_00420, partial [Acidimicrobiia bacterium]|nr:hypothetical protein [Acidimicrobiia bacterium]